MTKPEWKFIGKIVADGEFVLLEGLNPWDYKWNETGEASFEVPHPEYPWQSHRLNVYQITDGTKIVEFAASEVSNTAWVFYLPIHSPR